MRIDPKKGESGAVRGPDSVWGMYLSEAGYLRRPTDHQRYGRGGLKEPTCHKSSDLRQENREGHVTRAMRRKEFLKKT